MRAREINRVISAVNSGKTEEEADLKTEGELELYRRIQTEAQQLFQRNGNWPVFELCELD
jgi:hypothetical protein